MYVPSERNFLSSTDGVNKVSNLLVGNLSEFAIEFRQAQIQSNGQKVELPINKVKTYYNEREDKTYITVDNDFARSLFVGFFNDMR